MHEDRARDLRAPVSRGEISSVLHQQAADVEVTIESGQEKGCVAAADAVKE